jgi:membrane protease subunit HflK
VSKRTFRIVSVCLPLLLLAAYAVTGVFQVQPGEVAVVRRFGRALPERSQPGLHLGLPWGMDRVDRVAVDRLQRVVVGYQEDAARQALPPGQLLTGDHNLVNVQATLFYKVRPDGAADYVTQADRVDGLLTRAAETAMAEWVAGRTVDEALLNGKVDLRPVLVEQVRRRVEGYRLGVEVLDASVALVAPPDEVKSAFDDVAREQTRIATKVNAAEQQAETDWRAALSEKYRTEQETAAYVRAQQVMARREADNFRARWQKYQAGVRDNPLYLRQIWDEERGKLFARLKANRQIGLLDDHLGPDGLDLTVVPPLPGKP